MKSRRIIFLTLVILILTSSVVLADIGPKPSINVYVENPPEEEYYLDLFINEKISDEYYDNLDDEIYNEEIMNHLEENIDGWRSATIYGTRIPLFTDLKGSIKGDRRLHSYSYVGTPKIFKIAIATENGLKLSNKIERKNYQSNYVLDYEEFMENGKVTGGGIKDFRWDLLLKTLVLTLIIEGIIFYLFKFDFKVDGLVFLLANIITQFGLHFYFMKVGYNAFLFFPGEIVVTIVEAVIYAFFFKEYTKGRRITYGIVANLASMTIGILLWSRGLF